MATPNVGILTNAGKNLIDQVNAGQTKITFSKIVFSSMNNNQLTDDQIKALTTVAPQEIVVNNPKVTLDNNTGETRIRATGNNEALTDGVYVKTYAVYAKDDSGNEILYGITVSPNPNYLPEYDGVTPQAVTYSYKVNISNTSNITFTNSDDIYVSDTDLAEALQPYAKTVDVNQQLATKVTDNKDGTIEVNGSSITPADDSKVVHSTDTSNWQKQALFNAGSYMIKSTLSAQLDFKTLLTTKFNDAGIYYIRDDYENSVSVVDSVVICEGGSWWYAYGVDYAGNFVHRKITGSTGSYDSGWVINADDSTVAHLSGANNFDTVPTVNNNPLLLASSLPSDLARTGSDQEFTGKNTFDTAPIDKTTGNPYITAKTPGIPKLAVTYNATSKAFDYTLTAPEKDGLSDIIQYNLLWKDHSVDDWTTVVVKPDALTGQLTGVDITKTYDFKAAAQNAVGSSDSTNVITLGTVDGNIYGVSWDGSSSGALQRTDAAVGLKAGINGAQNDFDTRGPWGLMDKTVTDSYGNAFVRVPKFYIRKTQNKPLSTWQVSLVKQGDDWYLPNCFYDFDTKKELDYVDVSRYEGSIISGKLQSKTGVTPTNSRTIIQLRSSAAANNTDGKKGYHLWDVHTLDALQTLFTIEFATLDSQSIMKGVTDSVLSNAESTGTADGVKGSSGNVDHSNGYGSMTYRGIENLYGNLAMLTDGLNISGLSLYSCDDATKYVSDTFTNPYYKVSYPLTSSTGLNITGLGFDNNHPGVTAPTSFNSDSYNTYYHDYGYVNGSGNYVAYTGGGWDWGAGGSGLWFWVGLYSSSYAASIVGSRLLKKAL